MIDLVLVVIVCFLLGMAGVVILKEKKKGNPQYD